VARPLRVSQPSTQISLNLAHRPPSLWPSLCLLLSLAGAGWGQEVKPEDLKAAIVVNFARYTEWPTNAFTTPDSFVVGILGSDPCAKVLRKETAPMKKRKLVVMEFKDLEGTEQCQVLLVTEAKAGKMPEVRAHLKNASVLTVVETGKTVSKEAIISLGVEKRPDKKTNQEREFYVWHANTSAARQASLTLTAELLKRAKTVLGIPSP